MIYRWRDLVSDVIVEVERPMAESHVEPTDEEAEKDGVNLLVISQAKWVKVVTGGSATIGFNQKGHW